MILFIHIFTCKAAYIYTYISFLHNMMLNVLFEFKVSDFLSVAESILLDIRTVCGFVIASFASDMLRENFLDCSRQQYGIISFCAMVLRYSFSSIHHSHH